MVKLILMRHAKSDWADSNLSDHDRSLNKRGRRDAPRMANWFVQNELCPDLILCSTAVRARATVELLMNSWPDQPPVHFFNELYLAPPETIVRCIRSDAGTATKVLVVGHNPGIGILASLLAGHEVSFPTAAVAVFAVPQGWDRLTSSTALELLITQVPKLLDDHLHTDDED